MCKPNEKMKKGIEQGCLGIHSMVERVGLPSDGQKKKIDDRECYELDKCNKFGEFIKYKNSSWGTNLNFGGDRFDF